MRIKNIMSATVFFPYAGALPNRGTDIKAGQLSRVVEAGRMDNKLLRRDLALGKILIITEAADAIDIDNEIQAMIDKGNKASMAAVELKEKEPTKLAIAEIPLVPKVPKVPKQAEVVEVEAVAEPEKVEEEVAVPVAEPKDKVPSLADLDEQSANATDALARASKANTPSKGGEKSSLAEISSFMKDIG